MPYWEIFSPQDAYDSKDKEAFSKAITDACVSFVQIPEFYVVVRFQEYAADEMYVGGKAQDNFVRVVTDTIARQMEVKEIRMAVMDAIEQAMVPFVKDRGFDWEIHLDETPMDLWRVNGIIPPPAYSEIEQLWAKENRPSPYDYDSVAS